MTAQHPAGLHRRGHPLTRLYPGWEMGNRVPGPAGVDVLTLHHPHTGQEAYWWLSPDNDVLACHALALKGAWRDALIKALDAPLQSISASLLDGTAPLPSEEALQSEPLALLRALPSAGRVQLITLWFQTVRAALHVIPPTTLLEQSETSPFPTERLQKLLCTRPAGPHSLACSPFHDGIIRANLTMTLEQAVACRFTDDQEGVTFYLFWPNQDEYGTPLEEASPILYLPHAALLVGDTPLTPLVPAFLLSWFIGTPQCIADLKQARPFALEDYGVGHASALWDNKAPAPKKAGQIASSFPFSSLLWGQSAFTRPLTPLEDTLSDDPPSPPAGKQAKKPYQPRKKKRKKGRKRRS